MKHTIIIALSALTAGCSKSGSTGTAPSTTSEAQETQTLAVSMYHSPFIDPQVAQEHPYDLDVSIERTGDDRYTLVASMDLFGGSFFVSPLATGDFKGKFRVEIAPNSDLELGTDLMETPRSREVIDLHPFIGGPVNWVNVDTRYAYPLIIHTDQDFDIGGKVIFTIEPKCTLEQIPLMFKYRSGTLTVERWKC